MEVLANLLLEQIAIPPHCRDTFIKRTDQGDPQAQSLHANCAKALVEVIAYQRGMISHRWSGNADFGMLPVHKDRPRTCLLHCLVLFYFAYEMVVAKVIRYALT